MGSLLDIPEDVMNEIEEHGLDSMTILKTIISQFSHLFKNSPERFKGKNDKLERL